MVQVRKLPCAHKIVDLLQESRRHSHRRTYQWLFKKITVFLRERREEANFESEVKGLSDGPVKPKTPGMPAACGGATQDPAPTGTGKRPPKQKQEQQAPAETVPGAPATTKGKGKSKGKTKEQPTGAPAGGRPSTGPGSWPLNADGTRKKMLDLTTAEKAKIPCSFHGRGVCRSGAACDFLHAAPAEDAAAAAAKAAAKAKAKAKAVAKAKAGATPGLTALTAAVGTTAAEAAGGTKQSTTTATASHNGTDTQSTATASSTLWNSLRSFLHTALPSPQIMKAALPLIAHVLNSQVFNSTTTLPMITSTLSEPTFYSVPVTSLQLPTPYSLDHIDALAANVVQQPSSAGELAFEILGDTAAGLTIGSRAELVRKGVPEALEDALCEQLANPVTFATGGGVQLSSEKA